jgi:putative ABC transport system permease protein
MMRPILSKFKLSLRLLARDWRAGELRLFVAALVIAVGAVTAVGFFNDRIERGMVTRSAELLGGDLVLSSSDVIAPAWLEAAVGRGLRTASAIDFASVVVRTARTLYQPDAITPGVPEPGSAWVEGRLLHALGLKLGERIDIGNAKFTVTRVLTYEPGRAGNFFAFAPRALINAADVERTGVIQPGSRVTYIASVAGATAAVRDYREWLAPQLAPNQRLLGPDDSNSAIARATERVGRYMGLTSLLAVLLAGVAIAMAARRYSARHYDMTALLRSFGATQNQVIWLYLPPLIALGLLASAAGAGVGFLVQHGIYYLVRDLFPVALPTPGTRPLLFGVLTGLLTLAGFAVVPVLRLKRVPPLRVLRRELTPLPPSAWAVYGAAGATALVLAWRYTNSWTLTLAVLGGAVGAVLALGAMAWALLRAARRLQRRVGVAWRFGLNSLWRRPRESVGQVLAFGLTLMAMALIALVRTDLLATWQAQLPADTPNHFAFNVLPVDVPAIERFFAKHAIRSQALYPMVRGRLTTINGTAVTQAVTKEQQASSGALQRDLNLTWSKALPPDNRLLQGAWWDGVRGDGARVSVEQQLAERLSIKLGDRLGFVIGGAEIEARVSSLRSVQWDSFHPNFFMIFEPGALGEFPATYITSFHLDGAQKPLLATLVRAFPTVTVLELDQFLAQVRKIVRQAALAVELILLFVLAAGFAVLYAALASSRDERLYEGALLRTFGASRAQLRAGHLGEFVALGVLAGVLAAIGAELSAYLLYARAFGLEYTPKWPVWLIAPPLGGLLIGAAGYWGTRRVVTRSPLSVLRET